VSRPGRLRAMSKFTSMSTFNKIYYTYNNVSMESEGCLISVEAQM